MGEIDSAYGDRPNDGRLKRILGFGVLISGVAYLGWRTTAFNPEAPIFSALFFAVELLGFVASLVVFFVALDRRKRTALPASPGLRARQEILESDGVRIKI